MNPQHIPEEALEIIAELQKAGIDEPNAAYLAGAVMALNKGQQ